jgi:hypothetical protein
VEEGRSAFHLCEALEQVRDSTMGTGDRAEDRGGTGASSRDRAWASWFFAGVKTQRISLGAMARPGDRGRHQLTAHWMARDPVPCPHTPL